MNASFSLLGVVAMTAAAASWWLAVPHTPSRRAAGGVAAASTLSTDSPGWLLRYRLPLSLICGVGGATVTGSPASWVVGVGLTAGTWVFIGRTRSAGDRVERRAAARDLVPLVGLFAAALEAGAPPGRALEVARNSLPGPAADRLAGVGAQLALGGSPQAAWTDVVDDPVLGPLGRAVARAEQTGAPIALIVSRLADELADKSRAEVEDRARAVGVKAAVPLGLCLLPSFLLIGIVPVAAGLLRSFT